MTLTAAPATMLCWGFTSLLLLTSATAAYGQTERNVRFPSVTDSVVSECTTPTTIDLPGGGTATFTGGQFIHYHDANYDGPMYATREGCIGSYFQRPDLPNSINVTFTPGVDTVSVVPYNYSGRSLFIAIDAATVSGFYARRLSLAMGGTAFFPNMTLLPLPGEPGWRAGAPDPAFTPGDTHVGRVFGNAYDFPVPPAPLPYAWGIVSLKVSQSGGDIVKFDYSSDNAQSTDDGKILLSTAPWDLSLPSKYQRGGGGPVATVSGTLLDGTTKQPKAGTVWLRLVDPPDAAPYRGGDAHDGDNDGTAPKLAGTAATPGTVVTIPTDAEGRFQTTLEVTDHIAGDNYQVEGASNDRFMCPSGPCARTGVFTVWKRVYAEEEHMFRQGSFLNGRADAGTDDIPVDDPAPFQNLPAGSALELVHADSGNGEGFYSEVVTFSSLLQTPNGLWIVRIDPNACLVNGYGAPNSLSAGSPVDATRDGIGVVAAGAYAANDMYTPPLFASAFVDLQPGRVSVSETPYVREMNLSSALLYSYRWFESGTRNGVVTISDPNTFHRIAATQSPAVQIGTGWGAELGATVVDGGTNFSYVWDQRIQDLTAGSAISPAGILMGREYAGLDPSRVNGETTAHETVHFWVHDPLGADGHGHCLQTSWRNPQLNCLMHEPYPGPGLDDGLVDVHYAFNGADSEYMTIRRAVDPVPQE